MAREEKKIELRTVDEAEPVRDEVVRLRNEETPPDRKPVRLVGPSANDAPHRLDVPTRENFEARTHQPGIEALIEPAGLSPDVPETDWGIASSRHKHIPWGWFALIALVLAGAAVWSLTRVGKSEMMPPGERGAAGVSMASEEADELEAARLVDRIDLLVRKFFHAGSMDEMAKLVRQPERVRPLMEKYYAAQPFQSHAILDDALLEPLTLGHNGDFWMKSVQIDVVGMRYLLIDASDPAHPLVDWETYVCYQPMPWDEFATKRPEGKPMDFRVLVAPDHFFAHEFADSGSLACYQLTIPDSERSVFGYVEKDSDVAREIEETVMQNDGQPSPMILRLTIPPGLESRNGAVIERVLSPRWLYIDPPDPGS